MVLFQERAKTHLQQCIILKISPDHLSPSIRRKIHGEEKMGKLVPPMKNSWLRHWKPGFSMQQVKYLHDLK